MRSSFGLKVLGLCALLVGLMSFGAGAAQAEVGAYWLVSGKKITAELQPELQAALENKTSSLLTKLSNKNIHILCTAVELEETHLLEPNGRLLGKAKFSGCIFLELLVPPATKEIKFCNPKEGIILTNKVEGLITLHEGEGRILLKPDEPEAKGTFANIFLGPECAFGEKLNVGGELVLKDCQKAFLTDQVTHLVEEDKVLTKLWVNSETNPATIDGSANAFLGIGHKGLTFAGHPI
jgi:hypothetical protein